MVAEPPAADDREDAASKLERILADQPEEVQARYPHRRPAQTLEFFGIQPGMTVVEALPGGGWYSRILLPYLGSEGRLIGANYPARHLD
jgi:predicted methyltransferase